MNEQKFTEEELLEAAELYRNCKTFHAMLTQAARAVAEVEAWEQALREVSLGTGFHHVIINRVAAILREKKEKQ